MTPRSLFNIVLKIIGIFFIKDILAALPQLFSVFYMIKYNRMEDMGMTVAVTLLTLLIYIVITYYLVFKSEWVIDKLKLDRGFDQDNFPLNIHRSTVLSISIIVIGGLLVADEIPNFFRQVYEYYLEMKRPFGRGSAAISYPIVSAAKILIGLLLIGNQQMIVNFIERKRKSKPDLQTWDSSADNGEEEITEIK
jgi:hypothetical protein